MGEGVSDDDKEGDRKKAQEIGAVNDILDARFKMRYGQESNMKWLLA